MRDVFYNPRLEMCSICSHMAVIYKTNGEGKPICYNCAYPNDTDEKLMPYVTEIHTGRNEPCPCGSGNKYKKCCMNKDKNNNYV